MVEKETKEKVSKYLNLASDIKEAKITTSVDDVTKIDGRFKANFRINGLPRKDKDDYESSYKYIPKIFDTSAQLAEYIDKFLSMPDDEIIELCNGKTEKK